MLTHSDPRKGTLPNFESVDSQNWVGDKDPLFRDGANPFLNMVVHVIGHRVQWISGGGCVLVISFLTCHLLFQLFELDIFRL